MSANPAIPKLPPVAPQMRGAITGVSGTGKGNCAKAWIAREIAAKRAPRVVVFDPDDEYSKLGHARPGHVHLGPLTHRVTADAFLSDVGRWLDHKFVSLAVVPSDDDDEASEQCFEFCKEVKATGDLLVVFDEIGGYAFDAENPRPAQRGLKLIATKARKDNVSALFVAQRAMQIPKTARGQINALETFAQFDDDDLKQLAKWTGDRSLIERAPKLPRGQSLAWVSPML